MNHFWKFSLIVAVAIFCPSANSDNKYDDAQGAGINQLNKSLSKIGQCVVVTVSSPGDQSIEYYSKLPNEKYSPSKESVILSYAEVTKRINAAVEKAKKNGGSSTITIAIETKAPKK